MRHSFRKLAVLAGVLAAAPLLGGTCFPLFDLNADDAPDVLAPMKLLTVSVRAPSADHEVPTGTIVTIEWTMANLTSDEAIVTVLIRDRSDLSDTVIAGGLRIGGTGSERSVDWDTSDFAAGRYDTIVRVEAGAETAEDVADGQVTVNAPPSFEFTEPVADFTLGQDIDPNDPNMADQTPTITIRWSAEDFEGSAGAQLGVDPDLDHESENEIVIVESSLPSITGFDALEWDGTALDGSQVDAGVYNLYARVDDTVNPVQFVEGLARVTIPDELVVQDQVFALEFTKPRKDKQFLASDAPRTLEYTLDEDDDVLIDLAIDIDDNHQNANETTIDFQRLVEQGQNKVSFDWAGLDKDGAAVPDNIYRVYMVLNRGDGNPRTIDADGLIFRRSTENKPLIALLEPAADLDATRGSFVTIKWRDDDPAETATVFLTLDSDDQPGNEVLKIRSDLSAKGDGVQDTFEFKIPPVSELAPGTYFILAGIGRDGATEHNSVAVGRITIEAP